MDADSGGAAVGPDDRSRGFRSYPPCHPGADRDQLQHTAAFEAGSASNS